MTSNFLTRLLKRGSGPPRPQVDMHALFTSAQMSTMILQGQLSVHEPWRRHKKKPKIVYVCLYTNDSSPFIVWYTDKAHKKPRGFFNVRGGKIAPVGEFSFQIAFKDKTSQIYKFNTSSWERREEWLHLLRKESRKEVQMPLIETICNQDYRVSQDDLAITMTAEQRARQQQLRPEWKGHRRTVSAGSPSPQRCVVQLQRSRSQPHIQKGRLIKRRPTVLEKHSPTLGQAVQNERRFIRTPEVCRS
ncbi:uncharacterized protein LOC119731235 [Patiria miniata]|uniref:PH domain-containing protein n=1 Tax=Patiria miniata TaxID=46514 RepID=A0A914A8S3_PATMI|nr:uncharacterized protein LOC119731235 [Patiria miniata]